MLDPVKPSLKPAKSAENRPTTARKRLFGLRRSKSSPNITTAFSAPHSPRKGRNFTSPPKQFPKGTNAPFIATLSLAPRTLAKALSPIVTRTTSVKAWKPENDPDAIHVSAEHADGTVVHRSFSRQGLQDIGNLPEIIDDASPKKQVPYFFSKEIRGISGVGMKSKQVSFNTCELELQIRFDITDHEGRVYSRHVELWDMDDRDYYFWPVNIHVRPRDPKLLNATQTSQLNYVVPTCTGLLIICQTAKAPGHLGQSRKSSHAKPIRLPEDGHIPVSVMTADFLTYNCIARADGTLPLHLVSEQLEAEDGIHVDTAFREVPASAQDRGWNVRAFIPIPVAICTPQRPCRQLSLFAGLLFDDECLEARETMTVSHFVSRQLKEVNSLA